VPEVYLDEFIRLDQSIRKKQEQVESLRAKKNAASKFIGQKKRNQEDVTSLLKEMEEINQKIFHIDDSLQEEIKKRNAFLLSLPNIPLDSIPVSLDPKDNVTIRQYKEKTKFSFPFKNHLELNKQLKLFDFERGAKISGRGFPIYTNRGAKLEWALLNYMLDIHRKEGYNHIIPPLLVKKEVMEGVAQLPKFADQLFQIQDKDFHLYLIPTAEAALNGLHQDEIINESALPLFYTAYTPCFRREAGAAGTNERGLIRTHQFNKVEMFALCTPEESANVFAKLIQSAQTILEGLELHYRNMLLVTKDMSFASAKTVDLEVFLPGQDRYYEVSSISNCTDFQARRAKIRYRKQADKKTHYVHTLNGSGVATSRLMVALLENHQQADGSVLLPKALYPYLHEDMLHLKPI
jgi:seryl-tRNA synthetase